MAMTAGRMSRERYAMQRVILEVGYVLVIENVKQAEAFPGEGGLSKVATRIVQVKAYQGFSTPSPRAMTDLGYGVRKYVCRNKGR